MGVRSVLVLLQGSWTVVEMPLGPENGIKGNGVPFDFAQDRLWTAFGSRLTALRKTKVLVVLIGADVSPDSAFLRGFLQSG